MPGVTVAHLNERVEELGLHVCDLQEDVREMGKRLDTINLNGSAEALKAFAARIPELTPILDAARVERELEERRAIFWAYLHEQFGWLTHRWPIKLIVTILSLVLVGAVTGAVAEVVQQQTAHLLGAHK